MKNTEGGILIRFFIFLHRQIPFFQFFNCQIRSLCIARFVCQNCLNPNGQSLGLKNDVSFLEFRAQLIERR
jgi:hypothetical protein